MTEWPYKKTPQWNGKCEKCEKFIPAKVAQVYIGSDEYNSYAFWCITCGDRLFGTNNDDVLKKPSSTVQPKKTVQEKNQKKKSTGAFTKMNPFRRQAETVDDKNELQKISAKEWPSDTSIENAIENIGYTCDNKELQNLKMEKDDMDLLYQHQGQFAVIYKGSNNEKSYALRLFTNKTLGEMNRYNKLYDFFNQNEIFKKCDYFTDFKYFPRAIRLKLNTPQNNEENWFPIIKMGWVNGKSLEDFIKETNSKDEIKNVADNFLLMVNKLEELKIAHGDLHPKNILVDDKLNLKLVDYDCIFVSDFKGQPQPELGDPDCQHPHREKFTYDEKLDRFSALVIYLGLIALSENIELKSHKDSGEFIFSKKDFVDTSSSKLFQKLGDMGSKVTMLTNYLIQYCKSKKPQIHSLNELLYNDESNEEEKNV